MRPNLSWLAPLTLFTLGLVYLTSPVLLACPDERPPIVIPFTLTEHNNIVVKAVVNETDTLLLMLHTASREVTLTEAGAQKAKSIQFTKNTTVKSWGGEANARLSLANQVNIGSLVRKNLTIWENKNSGPGTDGKFGLDFFTDRIIEIDFDRSQILLHQKLPPKAATYDKLAIDNQDGQLMVQGCCIIEGTPYPHQFLLHTGYSGGILLDDAFAQKTGVDSKIKITDETSLKDSFGHTIKVKKGIVPVFQLGQSQSTGTQIKNAPLGFFTGGQGQQKTSVLGSEILKRFHLIFDLQKGQVYLRRR